MDIGGLLMKSTESPRGLQFCAEFLRCDCSSIDLEQAPQVVDACRNAIKISGLTPLGDTFHQFQPVGATAVVLLAESHLAVHTWPELKFVSIDLYVCNYGEDNTAKAQAVIQHLRSHWRPQEVNLNVIERGKIGG